MFQVLLKCYSTNLDFMFKLQGPTVLQLLVFFVVSGWWEMLVIGTVWSAFLKILFGTWSINNPLNGMTHHHSQLQAYVRCTKNNILHPEEDRQFLSSRSTCNRKGDDVYPFRWNGSGSVRMEETNIMCNVCRKSAVARGGRMANWLQHLWQWQPVEWEQCVKLWHEYAGITTLCHP